MCSNYLIKIPLDRRRAVGHASRATAKPLYLREMCSVDTKCFPPREQVRAHHEFKVSKQTKGWVREPKANDRLGKRSERMRAEVGTVVEKMS
jgi:hypothetical protein